MLDLFTNESAVADLSMEVFLILCFKGVGLVGIRSGCLLKNLLLKMNQRSILIYF